MSNFGRLIDLLSSDVNDTYGDEERAMEKAKAILMGIPHSDINDTKLNALIINAGDDFFECSYAENKYIQNNTKAIVTKIKVTTPSFNVHAFLDFVKDVFIKLTEDKNRARLEKIVGKNIDYTQLPDYIDYYDLSFLNNYIISKGKEAVKILVSIVDGNDCKKYFLTFERQNPMFNPSNGEPIIVKCPYCGGSVEFINTIYTTCKFCSNTVGSSEYDWILDKGELITDETRFTNRAIIKIK